MSKSLHFGCELARGIVHKSGTQGVACSRHSKAESETQLQMNESPVIISCVLVTSSISCSTRMLKFSALLLLPLLVSDFKVIVVNLFTSLLVLLLLLAAAFLSAFL